MLSLHFFRVLFGFLAFELVLAFVVARSWKHDGAMRADAQLPKEERLFLHHGQAVMRVLFAALVLAVTVQLHVLVLGTVLTTPAESAQEIGALGVAVLATTTVIPGSLYLMLRRYESNVAFGVTLGSLLVTLYFARAGALEQDWRMQIVLFYFALFFTVVSLATDAITKSESVWVWEPRSWTGAKTGNSPSPPAQPPTPAAPAAS